MTFSPVCPDLMEQNQQKMQALMNHEFMILSDFDGTVSTKDVTDLILEQFADPTYEVIEQEWLEGKIGSKECMSQQIKLLDMTKNELDSLLKTVQIDPYFAAFSKFLNQHKIQCQIVSDGLDYAIQTVLKAYHFPIYANQLLYNGDRQWKMAFPYSAPNCLKKSGNCKCHHLTQQRSFAPKMIYIGDGASDFCVAHHADLIFAKDKLIDYCEQHHLPYIAIEHFGDIQTYLKQHILKI